MCGIHEKFRTYGERDGGGTDYVRGANIGGFTKVANALQECGVV
ncbi:MAG: glutamate dehydrogenase (NADP+) [Verrucomicrobiales bacterium]|jgi:glutamate dehydrogenase (NADP+)